jgi:HK97 family phage portal protein
VRSLGRTLVRATGISGKAPVPYTPRWRANPIAAATRQGTARQVHAMGSIGTLFSIVDGLSENVAMTEWKLWRKSPSGKPEDRTEVTDHLALRVLNNPNPFMTRQELIESLQQHYELVGESWTVTVPYPGTKMPQYLWPVRPDRMVPKPHPTKFLSGYTYLGPEGEKVELGLDEVIQIRRPNPVDPYRGIGAVQSILIDLDSSRASAEWNASFLRNNAQPGGIIEVPEGLEDNEYNQLVTRWNENHQGPSNAGRVAILEFGVWKDRQYSMRDMQFAELRQVNNEIIREAFRFPKAMLGTVEDVNRANAEANEVIFARWLLKPRLERIKQMLNNDFLPKYGSTAQGLEFDYCDPVPADRELGARELTARVNAATALIYAGGVPESVLEALELPEIEFRDRPEPQPFPTLPGPQEQPEPPGAAA